MDGTRGERLRRWGAPQWKGGACAVLPGWESSSGVSREERGHTLILLIRMKTLDSICSGTDQRAGRLISGSQSFSRRLSSQNTRSFSRDGSSQEPSAGFCGTQGDVSGLERLRAP